MDFRRDVGQLSLVARGVRVRQVDEYVTGASATTWHLLMADDFRLDAGGPAYRVAIMSFFLWCSLFRLPFSWNKTSGDTVARSQLGITQRRADWFVRWSLETASATYINLTRFEEGLGCMMYVAGA